MSKVVMLWPKEEWHTNNKLRGYDDIPDLPITRLDDESIVSVWHTKSIWARLVFLLTGKIYMSCLGYTHPPVGLYIGEYVVKKK